MGNDRGDFSHPFFASRRQDRQELLEFTSQLVRLRHEHPVLRKRRFFRGDTRHAGGKDELGDVDWLTRDGKLMDEQHWQHDHARTMAVFLNGDGIAEPDPRGHPVVDDSLLVLFNGHHEQVTFNLPPETYGERWQVLVDTAHAKVPDDLWHEAGGPVPVAPRGTVVMARPRAGG